MKSGLYSILDVRAGFFSAPFVAPNHLVARRVFAQAVQDPASTLNKWPADFQLHHVGEFDDAAGYVQPREPVQFLSSGVNVMEDSSNERS